MRGLCGWFGELPGGGTCAALDGMTSAAAAAGMQFARHEGGAAALAAFGSPARWFDEDGFVLAVVGHPRLRGNAAPRSGELADIAHALRSRGRAALADIGGDFALAAWDASSRRGLLAIDRIGIQQLVWTRSGQALVFGTTLDQIGAFPGVSRRLSPQALYDYLYYHVVPGPNTVFEGQFRLQPGHCVEFGAGTSTLPQCYWVTTFAESVDRTDEAALKAQFTDLLEQAVAEAGDRADCGSFLSGGTDSSTVSGMLGRVSGRPARAFSIGFDVPGFDETAYARIAAGHFGCEHHQYYVTPQDVVAAVPRIAATYDQPFGNASAIPTYYCAKFAHDNGVGRMLAGDGGDELFGGNERYGKQHLLSLYQHIPAGLRNGVLEPLLLSGTPSRIAPLAKLQSYMRQARPAMPWRYESYNLLQHLGADQVLTPEFLAGVDPEHPRRLLGDAHAPYARASLVNQMLGIDLRFILADGDLPKVTRMCELAGVDVTFPLLDDRLVDFAQVLPAPLKLRGTQLRWFFKRALSDFLPPEIITKPKHGFGLPVGQWLLDHEPLRALAMDSIALLRPRGIVRQSFIDELVKVKLREHPGYYGTMVWILMMLGLWLDSRRL